MGRRRPLPGAGTGAFDADDLQLLADISSAVGTALRARNLLQSPSAASFLSPGVLMFNAHGVLLSANLEARSWLGEIFGPEGDGETWAGLLSRYSFPDQLKKYPLMHSLVARARAVALGYDEGPARLRLRDRGGRWIVMHASCLDDTSADGPVAVVVEPAKSAEIAPLIVEAYQLSPRERDVVRGVARGLSTPEIATEALPVQPHRPRLHQVGVREGRRQQPRRADRQAVRRALLRRVARSARAHRLTMPRHGAPCTASAAMPSHVQVPLTPGASTR